MKHNLLGWGVSRRSGFTIVELLIVVVVIAILAAITIVSYNGITSQARASVMASDLSSWKKKAELHKAQNDIVCPENYVFIYGNSVLGTNDFCVMKYEARNTGGVATSQPDGTPWVNINQTNAISTAAAACQGCRLMTDAEWMTIAADVLQVKYNWSGGEVGKGFIYSGHNDNSPAAALTAAADDSEGYSGTGNSVATGANQRRTLYLSSGDVIWDLAGNVYEWTFDTIVGEQPGLASDPANAQSGSSKDWNSSGMTWGLLPVNSRPGALAVLPGLSSVDAWSRASGIGMLYSNRAQTNARAFLRGGGWGSGLIAGVLGLTFSNSPSTPSSNISFRVAR